MPKYTNSGSTVVSIGSLRLEPGESKNVIEFIPGVLPVGVTQDASTPSINPVILAQKVTGNATITIPETYTEALTGKAYNLTGNYMISIYVAVGECTVQFNGAGIARYVGLYEKFDFKCMDRVVDTIVLVVSGTVYVTVEGI